MKSQQRLPQLHKCIGVVLLLINVFLSLLFGVVLGDDYLKEPPSFLVPCSISDPKAGVCLAKAFENIFTNWKDGIPGLTSLGSIDPIHLKKVHFEQNNQNINLKLDLKNVKLTGLSKTKVGKVTFNDDYNFKFMMRIPSLHSKSDYKVKGNILVLNLDGTGTVEFKLSDLEVFISVTAKLIKVKDQKFFEITNVKSKVKNIGNFHVHFDNLFTSSSELTESANSIFNENWRDLFEIMRPAIEESLDAVSTDRYKKILNYVPATYFFVDLR